MSDAETELHDTKLSQTQKRRKRRKVAIKKQASRCFGLGRFFGNIGKVLIAPFTGASSSSLMEKKLNALHSQLQQLQKEQKTNKRKQSDDESSVASADEAPPAPPMDDEPPPAAPPMDDDAPPAPPMDDDPAPISRPILAIKPRKPGSRKKEPQRMGISLEDITKVKLRKRAGSGSENQNPNLKSENHAPLFPTLKSTRDPLAPRQGIDLAELTSFKLKKSTARSPGGTPRKKALSRGGGTTVSPTSDPVVGVLGMTTQNDASSARVFAALRTKFMQSPRGAEALKRADSN